VSRTRLLFITSYWTRWLSFEWITRALDREQFEVAWVVLDKNDSPLVDYLRDCDVEVHVLPYRSLPERTAAVLRIAGLCRAGNIDLVHVHFFGACTAGLIGAWLGGVGQRVHTRHYADPDDSSLVRAIRARIYNRVSTCIVAPSRVVERFLIEREQVPTSKIVRIDHGFDLDQFADPPAARVEAVRARHGIQTEGPVIGVISRWVHLKGVQYVIPAFRRVLERRPDAQLVLAGTRGDFTPQIRALLAGLPADRYVEVPFEDDVFALYQLFDVFVHVPIRPEVEAFGQVYVEALAAGVPSVFTASGIAAECVEHQSSAWLVPHRDSDATFAGIEALLDDPELCRTLRENGRALVRERFGLDTMIEPLSQLYAKASR
jgi:glycosyltransferase involved in cell wall biosynthesis